MSVDLSSVPAEVRRLVAELVAAELLEIGAQMIDARDRIHVGVGNARRNGAQKRHIDDQLALAEAFCHAERACLQHASDVVGRWQPPLRRRQPAAVAAVPLFDLDAMTDRPEPVSTPQESAA